MADAITYESLGLRLLRDDEKTTRDVRDWRGVVVGSDGPERPRRCDQSIDGGRATYSCSEPAKWVKDGAPKGSGFYCGRHAAGALRSAKTRAKNDAARRSVEIDVAVATRRLARLKEALGIDAELDYRSYPISAPSTTHAVVSLDDLERLVAQV